MRCQTRYCNKTCQHDHWRRGHKQICKKIYRGGGAEQYDADKKYAEAAAAAFVSAEDAAGATCYICGEEGTEGMVQGCVCRGTPGLVHLSCLVREAQMDGVPSLNDLNEAVALLEEVDRTCEELYDKSHGDSQVVKAELKKARAKLARARKAVARRAAATAKSTAAGA